MSDLEGQPLDYDDYGIVRVRVLQSCRDGQHIARLGIIDRDGEVSGVIVDVPARCVCKLGHGKVEYREKAPAIGAKEQ
jgi:hypothetical protein